jgi:glutathione peroxidase-family protein
MRVLCRSAHTQVDVNGPEASPVYNFLKASAQEPNDVEWNFGKFLVGCAPARWHAQAREEPHVFDA